MGIHFHDWEKLWDVEFNPLKYEIKRIYRHCLLCGKWQRFHGEWAEKEWKNSNMPKNRNLLIDVDEAKEKIKKIEMEQESM